MSRPLRIQYEGAHYHVMNRGLGKKRIFYNDAHRQLFLELLFEVHNRYQVKIHAYCLMDNHYHLFLETPQANLGRSMRHLNGVFTQRYNRLIKSDGPIFRGRYKSILVEADSYFLRLGRYIHLNPVAAGIVKQSEDYVWSSYRAFLGLTEKPYWLTVDNTLSYFDYQAAHYKNYIEKGIDKELDIYFNKLSRSPILGSDEFTQRIKDKYLADEHCIIEIPQHKQLYSPPSIEAIITATAEYYKINERQLRHSQRGKKNPARSISMYLARQYGQHKLRSIAESFGNISYAAVSRICQQLEDLAKHDPSIKNEIEKIAESIRESGY